MMNSKSVYAICSGSTPTYISANVTVRESVVEAGVSNLGAYVRTEPSSVAAPEGSFCNV